MALGHYASITCIASLTACSSRCTVHMQDPRSPSPLIFIYLLLAPVADPGAVAVAEGDRPSQLLLGVE